MEVVEASPDLAPILASYAKECLESGIPKYSGVEQEPGTYPVWLNVLRQLLSYQTVIYPAQLIIVYLTLKS
ncbi:hypothetical protein IFVP18_C190006 [Vibrio parahaemolyticus]